MFSLPILPDTLRIPLDRVTMASDESVVVCTYPGVVAIARPLDLEAASKWNDEFPGSDHRSWAATKLVKDHLIGFDGLTMQDAETGAAVAYDHANEKHWRSVPMDLRSGIFVVLKGRAELTAVTEKNSDSPSASDGTTSTASSVADSVASPPATT